MKTVAIIGCGNLGIALAEGMLDSKTLEPYNIIATRRNTSKIDHLEEKGVTVTSDNVWAVQNADIVMIGVKPHVLGSVVEEIGDHLDSSRHLVVSLAMGVTIDHLHKSIDTSIQVFRAMPNTAAAIKESFTCICHLGASKEQLDVVSSLFDCVGETMIIQEDLMDAATILGPCGIAFTLRFVRAMIQGGIQIGFRPEEASLIVGQTVNGAVNLLLSGDSHPEAEIDKVTTPKGCTIVALNEMEVAGFSSSIIKGIIASYNSIVE